MIPNDLRPDRDLQAKLIRCCNELGYFPDKALHLLSFDEVEHWFELWRAI